MRFSINNGAVSSCSNGNYFVDLPGRGGRKSATDKFAAVLLIPLYCVRPLRVTAVSFEAQNDNDGLKYATAEPSAPANI